MTRWANNMTFVIFSVTPAGDAGVEALGDEARRRQSEMRTFNHDKWAL